MDVVFLTSRWGHDKKVMLLFKCVLETRYVLSDNERLIHWKDNLSFVCWQWKTMVLSWLIFKRGSWKTDWLVGDGSGRLVVQNWGWL